MWVACRGLRGGLGGWAPRGAVSVFGGFGLVVGVGGGSGALSVLGGFIAQSICKCVVRKLILYLVYTEFIILEIKSHFTCGELNLF